MEPEQKSNGAFIGLTVIIIILIIGGIYIWQSNKNTEEPIQNENQQSETITSQDANALNALELESQAIDVNTGVDASKIQ